MKYKAGDKVKVKEWKDLELEYKVNEDGEINFDAGFTSEMSEFCGKELVIKKLCDDSYICLGNKWKWQDWMFEDESKSKSLDYEQIIIQLTELNALKTRQLDDLMRFIARVVIKETETTPDVTDQMKRDYLLHHVKDIQLVDGILYHIRKGNGK